MTSQHVVGCEWRHGLAMEAVRKQAMLEFIMMRGMFFVTYVHFSG